MSWPTSLVGRSFFWEALAWIISAQRRDYSDAPAVPPECFRPLDLRQIYLFTLGNSARTPLTEFVLDMITLFGLHEFYVLLY